jgi:hypothetical protein
VGLNGRTKGSFSTSVLSHYNDYLHNVSIYVGGDLKINWVAATVTFASTLVEIKRRSSGPLILIIGLVEDIVC